MGSNSKRSVWINLAARMIAPQMAVAAAVAILAGSSARATVAYGSGGSVVVNSVVLDSVDVSNGTAFTLNSPGKVAPLPATTDFAAIHSVNSSVTIANGATSDATSTGGRAWGVQLTGGSFSLSGAISATGTTISEGAMIYGASNFNIKPTASVTATLGGVGGTSTAAYAFVTSDSATGTIEGGTFKSNGLASAQFSATVGLFGSSHATVTGGTFQARSSNATAGYVYGLFTRQTSQLDLKGGSVSASGGVVNHDLAAFETSTVRIFGTGFSLNGTTLSAGSLVAAGGFLAGVLSDGTSFNYDVYRDAGASIVLVDTGPALPEPASASVALIFAGAGALSRRRSSRR